MLYYGKRYLIRFIKNAATIYGAEETYKYLADLFDQYGYTIHKGTLNNKEYVLHVIKSQYLTEKQILNQSKVGDKKDKRAIATSLRRQNMDFDRIISLLEEVFDSQTV